MTDNERDSRPRPPASVAIASAPIDVQTGRNGVGTGPGYSGQEYDANDFAIARALGESAAAEAPAQQQSDGIIPRENGRKACFDQATGAVRGSGSGAGGGNPGEDFASDPAAGDGFPQTGRGARKDREHLENLRRMALLKR